MVRVVAPQPGAQLPAFRSAPVDEVEEESMRLPRQKLESLGEPLAPLRADPLGNLLAAREVPDPCGCLYETPKALLALYMEGQVQRSFWTVYVLTKLDSTRI